MSVSGSNGCNQCGSVIFKCPKSIRIKGIVFDSIHVYKYCVCRLTIRSITHNEIICNLIGQIQSICLIKSSVGFDWFCDLNVELSYNKTRLGIMLS